MAPMSSRLPTAASPADNEKVRRDEAPPIIARPAPRVWPGYAAPLDLDAVFSRAIKPVRVSPLYIAAMGVVVSIMLVLPLIYLALIAGVGWLVYLHAANDTGLVTAGALHGGARVMVFRVFLYAAPIALGATV